MVADADGSHEQAAAVALVVAAGSGARLGASVPKAFVQLAGRTLLQWSVDVLRAAPSVGQIVVALPEGWSAPGGTTGVRGGRFRSESVRNALEVAERSMHVVVHDAARPLATVELIEMVLGALSAPGVDAAVAAAPVSDTIKRAVPLEAKRMQAAESLAGMARRGGETQRAASSTPHGFSHPIVAETLDRSELWAVQTPQAFRRETLTRALDVPDEVLAAATDDASLVERSGGGVALVASGPENLKITTPLDLELAALLLGRRRTD